LGTVGVRGGPQAGERQVVEIIRPWYRHVLPLPGTNGKISADSELLTIVVLTVLGLEAQPERYSQPINNRSQRTRKYGKGGLTADDKVSQDGKEEEGGYYNWAEEFICKIYELITRNYVVGEM
jgi:hypothetical protein